MTISVSVERYLSVQYPNNTFKIKKCLIPLPIAFAILYNLPKFFEFVTCDNNKSYISSYPINAAFPNLTNETIQYFPQYNKDEEENNSTKTHFFFDIQDLVEKAYNKSKNSLKENVTNEEDDLLDCKKGEYGVTLLRKNRWYIILYVFWSDVIFIEMIPWIIIVVLNLLTWRSIRQFQKNRKRFMRTHSPGNDPNLFNKI